MSARKEAERDKAKVTFTVFASFPLFFCSCFLRFATIDILIILDYVASARRLPDVGSSTRGKNPRYKKRISVSSLMAEVDSIHAVASFASRPLILESLLDGKYD